MFPRSGTLFIAAAAFIITVSAPMSHAGDGLRRSHHVAKRINIRNTVRIVDRSRTINIDRQRHRIHRQRDTYSGDVAIGYRRNVGTWSYGTVSSLQNVSGAEEPTVKIIDLQNGRNGCSMEKGVCVIRP